MRDFLGIQDFDENVRQFAEQWRQAPRWERALLKFAFVVLLLIAFLASGNVKAQQPQDNLPEPLQIARLNAINIGGGVPAAEGPTYAFHLEFESDADWSDGYTLGGNDYSIGGATTLTVVTAMARSDAHQAHGGTYSAYNPIADSGNMQVPITAKDHFDSAQGYISLWYYFSTSGVNYIFEARDDSNDYLYIIVNSDNTVILNHAHDNGVGVKVLVTNDDNAATLTADQWNQIEVRWSTSGDKLESRLNSGTWVNDADDDPVGAFNDSGSPAEPSLFYIGESNGSIQQDNYIDDFSTWVTYGQN